MDQRRDLRVEVVAGSLHSWSYVHQDRLQAHEAWLKQQPTTHRFPALGGGAPHPPKKRPRRDCMSTPPRNRLFGHLGVRKKLRCGQLPPRPPRAPGAFLEGLAPRKWWGNRFLKSYCAVQGRFVGYANVPLWALINRHSQKRRHAK